MTELVDEQPLNETITQRLAAWIAYFEPLLTPISLLLQLTRSTTHYDNATAHTGVYQRDSPQALA
ncbi:MAG: cell division protein ZapD [Shewanella sp.]